MNFQALATPAGGASAVAADALIVVLPADGKAGTLDCEPALTHECFQRMTRLHIEKPIKR